jgi:hypothetical protein
MARISSQWPRSMIEIRAESSHQNSRSSSPNVVAHDATKATEMAMPISSIMPGCLERISETAPDRKGQPP